MKTSWRMFLWVVVTALSGGAGFEVRAQTVARWTFETSQPGGGYVNHWFTNIQSEVGSGVASIFHNIPSVVYSPVGNGSAHSLTTSNWTVGDFYQFWVNASGYSHLSVSFDITSTSSGPGRYLLEYSTDGSNFSIFGGTNTIVGGGSSGVPTWSGSTYNPIYTANFDLSSVTALDNSPVVVFRLVDPSTLSAGGGTVTGPSLEVVDNFTVSVPEPNVAGLLSFWLAGGLCLSHGMARRFVATPVRIKAMRNPGVASCCALPSANPMLPWGLWSPSAQPAGWLVGKSTSCPFRGKQFVRFLSPVSNMVTFVSAASTPTK